MLTGLGFRAHPSPTLDDVKVGLPHFSDAPQPGHTVYLTLSHSRTLPFFLAILPALPTRQKFPLPSLLVYSFFFLILALGMFGGCLHSRLSRSDYDGDQLMETKFDNSSILISILRTCCVDNSLEL